MEITPDERADALRWYEEFRRNNAQRVWLAKVDSRKRVRLQEGESVVLDYCFPQGSGIVYSSPAGVCETSKQAFKEFAQELLARLDAVEQDILKKNLLKATRQYVRTMLRKKETFADVSDPVALERFLSRKHDCFVQKYEGFAGLPSLPDAVLEQGLHHVGDYLLHRLDRTLIQAYGGLEGETLRIDNLGLITETFSVDGSLLFDLLDVYYTEEESSMAFKQKLKEYAGKVE